MKKNLLSIAILVTFFACNQTNQAPVEKPLTLVDSLPPKKDAIVIKQPATVIGTGLTQEELADDSVFADGSIPTSWATAGITDVKGFKLFLKKVQLLVLNNDKEQLAKLVKYPLRKSIKNENDLVKNYEVLFTKDVKLSVAGINFSQVFRNSKGAMSEDGRLWFAQEENEFKIIAVNN